MSAARDGRRDGSSGRDRQREPARGSSRACPRSAASCWPSGFPSRRERGRPAEVRRGTACPTAGSTTRWCSSPSATTASSRIVCHRSEMGQGVRTGMPMIVADELEADWKRVRVVQAPGDEKRFGNQDTDGSRSTRHFFEPDAPLRRGGADHARGGGRRAVERAGRARWRRRTTRSCTPRRAGGWATARSPRRPRPSRSRRARRLRLKDPSQVPLHRQGQPEAGRRPGHRHRQGAVRHRHAAATGMLYAVVARPPVYGGKVASYDAAEALKVPGVRQGGRDRADAAAPAAVQPAGRRRGGRRSNTWAAMQGRQALKIVWDDGPNGSYDSTAFKAELEESARKPGKVVRNDGDFDAAMAGAAKRHRSGVLHSPPRARDDGAAGRDGAHRQRQVRGVGLRPVAAGRARPGRQAARHLGRRRHRARHAARRRVRPQVQARLRDRGGGALARRWTASRSRSTWTREDDLHHAYFHTVSVEHLEAGARRAGQAGGVAASQRRADASSPPSRPGAKNEAPFELGMGVINVPFAIPNVRIENPEAAAHTRIGWFRSVSNIPHAFAVQSFVAELAAAAGRDHEGLSAGGDRAGAPGQPGDAGRHVEPRRVARALSGRHRPAAARGGDGRARGGLGPQAAQGPRARHRRALQLRELRRGGRRGGGRRRRAR